MIEREKKQLRRKIKAALAAMGESERRSRSLAIHDRLAELALYNDAQTVLAYASFGTEVQTDDLLKRVLSDGKRLALPRMKPSGHSLALHEVNDLAADLNTNKYNIREPRPELPMLKLRDIQLILVPGLAFDEFGNRLGRGLGCYDRLLEKASPDNTLVALAFETQIVGGMDIPECEYDVPMDVIVTESRMIDRRDVFEMLKRREKQMLDAAT